MGDSAPDAFMRQLRHDTESSSSSSEDEDDDKRKASHPGSHYNDEGVIDRSWCEKDKLVLTVDQARQKGGIDFPCTNGGAYVKTVANGHDQSHAPMEFHRCSHPMEFEHESENGGKPRFTRQSVLQGLSEALMRRSLTKIDLSQRGLRPVDARLIKMVLAQNTQIKVLKLGYNSLGDEGVQMLCPAVAEHATLESLDIGFNQVGNIGCKALMDAISENNSLGVADEDQRTWTLYLAGNLIGEDGALSIADLIARQTLAKKSCVVRRLYLTGNKLGSTGVRAIAEAILHDELTRRQQLPECHETEMEISNHPLNDIVGGLEELFLGGTHMGDEGCSAVARLLAQTQHIKTLSLPNCDITDNLLCQLASCIKSNRALLPLESLHLSFNRISCRGMEALTNAVWASRSLKELLVDNNEIGDSGAQLLATIMPGLKGPLEILNVGFNKIKSSGMRVLMKAVAESRSVRSVSVAGNAVDTTSAKFIAYALAHNHSLLSISLDHCSIAQEGKRQIVAGIVSNSRTMLREVRGFDVGPVVVTLGFPAVMEHWNNEHVVNFIHVMWERSNIDETGSVLDTMDPLHFLGSPEGANEGSGRVGPHEASVVVDVAKKAFSSLVEEGVDVFSRRQGRIYGYTESSPIMHGDDVNATINPSTSPQMRSESTKNLLSVHPNRSFVAPPESSTSKLVDPTRKKRIVEWLCVNIQHLNKLGQRPFSSAELWKLHQHYFTPVVNESGGKVAPSPSPSADPLSLAMSSVPEVSITSTNNAGDTFNDPMDDELTVPKSDPSLKTSPFVGISPLPLLKRKVSYRFLGDAAIPTTSRIEMGNTDEMRHACSAPPSQIASVAIMIEGGPISHTMPYKTKRARRNRTRISFLPKVKGKLDSYLDVCHEKALVTMRQLFYVEHAILSGQVNPIDPATTARTHLCGKFALDAEMIVCDMI
ncbi:hypothetical protein MPSEU_000489100 [Mayamaea pseudoterrestris]|nr:hypothetical protein MPSEU_000489100 [Mayamaea pseudoterrestris]